MKIIVEKKCNLPPPLTFHITVTSPRQTHTSTITHDRIQTTTDANKTMIKRTYGTTIHLSLATRSVTTNSIYKSYGTNPSSTSNTSLISISQGRLQLSYNDMPWSTTNSCDSVEF
mgnify:CR=1 FL=1